jgi:hypothetical protein
MTLPFSSALPDGVQKLLGLPGSAGTVKEVLIGILVTVTVVWAIFKTLLWTRSHKR